MKWGDHCWLKGLQGASELNGKHVRLEEWVDDKQRWKCTPVGWSYSEEFVGVKPKNLSNEPHADNNKASSSTSSASSASSASSTNGPELVASLELLMKRGGELRGDIIKLFNSKAASDASLEASLRLGLCQTNLLEVQLEILLKGGSKEQIKDAKSKLNQSRNETAVQLKQWRLLGYNVPDYMEPPILADEELVKSDVARYRDALSARVE